MIVLRFVVFKPHSPSIHHDKGYLADFPDKGECLLLRAGKRMTPEHDSSLGLGESPSKPAGREAADDLSLSGRMNIKKGPVSTYPKAFPAIPECNILEKWEKISYRRFVCFLVARCGTRDHHDVIVF